MSHRNPKNFGNVSPWDCYTDALGRVYYYNKLKQQVLLYTMYGLIDTNGPWKKLSNCHGKVYYYNNYTKQSQWSKPEGFIDVSTLTASSYVMTPYGYAVVPKNSQTSESLSNKNAIEKDPKTHSDTENTNERAESEEFLKETQAENEDSKTEISLQSKRDFIEMLTEMSINPQMEWEEVLPAIEKDDRFLDAGSITRRKQIFDEWRETRKNDAMCGTEATSTKKIEHSLNNFFSENNELAGATSLKQVEEILQKDKRFEAIDNREMRDRILKQYSRKWLKNELREKRRKRLDQMYQIEAFLKDATDLTANSPWAEVIKTVRTQTFCNELADEEIWRVIKYLRGGDHGTN